ncbi:MAG TPA: ATP-binding protein [Planctomycetota bacterium]
MEGSTSSNRIPGGGSTAHTPQSGPRLPRFPLVIALLLLALGSFDLVEWFWLRNVDPLIVHSLHVAVGVVSALVIVVFVGWLIGRASHPITIAGVLQDSSLEPEPTLNTDVLAPKNRRGTSRAEAHLESYGRWFIQMRWIAVLVACVLILFSFHIVRLLPLSAEGPLWTTVIGLALCNAIYIAFLRKKKWTGLLLRVQVYVDLLCLAVLLHFSGSVQNPLLFLTVFHVVIAGILLSSLECYLVATVASLLIFVVTFAEWAHWLPRYTLEFFPYRFDPNPNVIAWYSLSAVSFLTVLLLLVAHFVTTLAERARTDERMARDMATRATAERQLLEQALTTTGAGLCVIDEQRRYLWMSRRWRQWFVREDAEVAEVPSDAWAGSPAQGVLKDGRVRVTEHVIQPSGASDREPRILQLTTAPVVDSQSPTQRIVELAQDITEQKRVQAQLLHAAKLAAVGGLAGNVVHEVNNPIGIISAKGRLLISDHREEMSQKVAEEILKITDAADRVATICHGLLSFCRPSLGQRSAIDVRIPLRRAVSMIEHRAEAGNIEISDQLPEQLAMVHANSNEVQQVFLNLLLNALDAMPNGGRLALSASEETGPANARPCVSVAIEDSGSGMPGNVLEQIFDPFFTTKEEGSGTGLGLPISLAIVQSHGGVIDVDSQPARGTRVAVKLPCEGPRDIPV